MAVQKPPKKFLCIDDDRTMLMITRQILTRSFGQDSLEFSEAFSGEDGLEKVSKIQPDIVLSDIQMPGLNGFEVCREIRKRYPKTAIILTSAYDAEQDNAIKAKEVGADAYLSKPVKKGELLFIINFILRVSNLNQTVGEKNRQLEESLDRVKKFHHKLVALNEELRADKKRLNLNLREMAELNSQLEGKNNQISSMMEEMMGRFDSTVSLLSNIIELNRSDRGHSERVAEMSIFIAEKLGLTEYQVQNVKVAARLHELGIVGMPVAKKEAAMVEERAGTKSPHPLVGEMLLKAYPGFELVADIIRHLHENVDGTGGPDGLYGDSIPVGARIVAAASYYDHEIIANPKLGSSGALAKMEEKKNIAFDDKVIFLVREYIELQEQNPQDKIMECTVFNLSEGMELASDIFSESGINLLRKDTVLNKETLNKIIKFNNVDPIVGPIKVKQS